MATILSNTVTLAAADLVAWAATPFTLVPAPGLGLLLVLLGIKSEYDFGTTPYISPDGNTSSSNQAIIGFPVDLAAATNNLTYLNDGMLLADASQVQPLMGTLGYPISDPDASYINQSLQVQLTYSPSGYTGGDGTLTITSYYISAATPIAPPLPPGGGSSWLQAYHDFANKRGLR